MDPVRTIRSLGIDIGTSTTKVVVSQLSLADRGLPGGLPRQDIVERTLLYTGEAHETPLAPDGGIDGRRVLALVEAELQLAGLEPGAAETGAVIVTGESSAAANAETVVRRLADWAGDFVAAQAGSDLEAHLAGLGAGSDLRSRELGGTVVNVDIGGGTANAAAFHQGAAVWRAHYHIGGRLVRLDRNGRIGYVSARIRSWMEGRGIRLQEGRLAQMEELRELCRAMAGELLHGLWDGASSDLPGPAGLRYGAVPSVSAEGRTPDELTVTGGIGQLMADPSCAPATVEETAVYGDIGPLLAAELREAIRLRRIPCRTAAHPGRATVIGAGGYSVVLSGSTITAPPELLPVRHVPVHAGGIGAVELRRRLGEAVELYGSDREPPFALAVPAAPELLTYAGIRAWAAAFSESWLLLLPAARTPVLICEADVGRALGQAIRLASGGRLYPLCIDQVGAEPGCYVDIGRPLYGDSVPVSVKTLVFLPPPPDSLAKRTPLEFLPEEDSDP
ncbi:ethanolamine ammonia-lyase reactivating factor EutA [Gorillibacterium sp. sgz5001074]|uniref:ethanolamine ammonia-lyase reactivating factor EutA n=1 Tax=Gorillibacterium sp. sgz5001074 TaxID=3446695 RepID=UPI003F6817E1